MKHKYYRKLTNHNRAFMLTIMMTMLCVYAVLGADCSFGSSSIPESFQVRQIKKDSVVKVVTQKTTGEKSYRVQVCALRKMIKDIAILEKGCGQSVLIEEQVDGYYKYVTASVNQYPEILKVLREIRSKPGFEGAFPVIYLDGKRIKPLYSVKVKPFSGEVSTQTNTINPEKKTTVPVAEQVAEPENKLKVRSAQQHAQDLPKRKSEAANHSETTVSKNEKPGNPIAAMKTLQPVSFKAGFGLQALSSTLLLPVLIFLAACFLLLVLYLFITHLLKMKKQRDALVLREMYAEELARYWSNPSDNDRIPALFEEANTDFRKDLLISEMMDILNTLSETAGDKIRELYLKLQFDLYSFKKLQRPEWTVQAMGIHELAAFKVMSEADSVEELVSNPHPVIRHEAISAVIRLRPSDPFGFLDRLHVPFTKRDQLSAIAVLEKHHPEVPAFSRWFDAYDPSLVVFAVEMACRYRQTEAGDHFDKLLRHSYEEVRISVIQAIGEMGLKEFSTRLIQLFNEEIESIQMLILQTMTKLEDPSLLNFLSDQVLLNSSMQIRMEAAKALIAIGPQGLTRMQTLLLKEDSDIRYIYHQIIS